MIIDNYSNYITLLAIEALYQYEDKTSINIDILNEFRNATLEEVLSNYKNNKPIYFQEDDQWQGEISFKQISEKEAINDFLDEYGEYFYLKDRKLFVKENVTFSDIRELLRQIRVNKSVSNRFDVLDFNYKLKNILGISSIEKIYEKYFKIEERLESLYYKLNTNEDTTELRNQIKSLLFIRLSFFTKITQNANYKVEAYRNTLVEYSSKNFKNYDKCPINMDLWNKEFADSDDIADIDDRIYETNQYAIFGKTNNPLYIEKFNEDIDSYYVANCALRPPMEEEYDVTKDYTDIIETDIKAKEQFEESYENHPENFFTLFDPSDEQFVFYTNYLNNLNNYMNIYGESEDLLLAKRRLTYVIDRPELMIFDNNNFERALNKAKKIELDEDPFYFYIDEFYFMAQEVFEVPSDEYTIRKLLLVGTYYSLTQDKELKSCIEQYEDNPRYEFFYEIMINNCKNNNPGSLLNEAKKLTLKSNSTQNNN